MSFSCVLACQSSSFISYVQLASFNASSSGLFCCGVPCFAQSEPNSQTQNYQIELKHRRLIRNLHGNPAPAMPFSVPTPIGVPTRNGGLTCKSRRRDASMLSGRLQKLSSHSKILQHSLSDIEFRTSLSNLSWLLWLG